MGTLSTVTRGSSRCHPRGLGQVEGRETTEKLKSIPNDKSTGVFDQFVGFPATFKINLTFDSIAKVDLTVDHAGKGGRARICEEIGMKERERSEDSTFEISHKSFCAAVEGIYDHLTICGTGYFYASVLETWSGGCALPRGFCAYMGCFLRKVERKS